MTNSLPPKHDSATADNGGSQSFLHITFPYDQAKDTNTARRTAMQQQALVMQSANKDAFSYSTLWGVEHAIEMLTTEILTATFLHAPFNRKLVFREVAKKCLEPGSLNEAIALLDACESPERADLVKERLTPEIQDYLLTTTERTVKAERKAKTEGREL